MVAVLKYPNPIPGAWNNRPTAVEPGEEYGDLIVQYRTYNYPNNFSRFLCKCKCGTLTIVSGKNLSSGNTTSCGCLKGKGRR